MVSDLHLRAGRGDDFMFDTDFASMLADLSRDGVTELVLNGDIFDFVATQPHAPAHPDPTLGLTEGESLARLASIAASHVGFFEALRRFVTDGGRCVFIPGNHDWELHFPEVRRLLAAHLESAHADRVEFVLHGQPYRPVSELHIEHGHQIFVDHNTFAYPSRPLRTDPLGGPPRIEQTLGNFLVRSLVNPLEELYPFVNNIRPFSKIRWFDLNHHAVNVSAVLSGFAAAVLRRDSPLRVLRWVLTTARRTRETMGAGLASPRVGADVMSMVADDQAAGLRRAARKLMGVMRRTRCVVFGHSHELVDGGHDFNRPTRRGTRLYLNPGSWLPCRSVDDEAEALELDPLCRGGAYPYQLAFVRAMGDSGLSEARCEVFARGEVWLAA